MTSTEIKKLYTKTKKAYEKRTGEKYTWVMNAKQQRLGTATVCVDAVVDYEQRLRNAEERLANFEHYWAEQVADYVKKAKKEAWENEHNPGWGFCDFWQKVMEPEHLAESKAKALEGRKRERDAVAAKLAQHGDFSHYFDTVMTHAREMIDSPELQSFLQEIGGTARIETNAAKTGYAEIYIRFHYQPTEA